MFRNLSTLESQHLFEPLRQRPIRVFDKEGEGLLQWVCGDVYVTDPAKAIGHTAAVVSTGWHAVDKSQARLDPLSSSPLLMILLDEDDMVDTESDNATATMVFSPNNKTLCVGITEWSTRKTISSTTILVYNCIPFAKKLRKPKLKRNHSSPSNWSSCNIH